MDVVYDPEKPQSARIYSWKRFWLAPSVFVAAGLLPLAVFLAIMRRLNL